MKSIVQQSNKRAAFTIVELLTVMSIIVILIGLLVPALNNVRKYAREVRQSAQFHSIGVALEQFNSQFDTYPDSGPNGHDGLPYCGAMKLAEAMVGQDLMGFHPDSVWNSSGLNLNKVQLYGGTNPDLSARKGPYLPVENANAYRMSEVYQNVGNFLPTSIVLCDVFGQVTNRTTGQKIGMPILYYKARPSKMLFDVANAANSIYNYLDNQELLMLGNPWDQNTKSRLATEGATPGARFYRNTENTQVTTTIIPYNKDTFILISAGNDGEYGTSDDICNFDLKYRPMQ